MIVLLHVVAASLACYGLWRLYRYAAAIDPFARRVITAGLLIRALAGELLFWISYFNLPIGRSLQLGEGFWFFGLDGHGFLDMARTALAGGPAAVVIIDKGLPSYIFVQVMAVSVALFGAFASIGLIINAASYLGMSAVITRWSASPSGMTTGGRICLFAVSFTPSWILWSLQPLKDQLFIFAVLVFLYGLQRVYEHWRSTPRMLKGLARSVPSVVALSIALYVVSSLRYYFGILLWVTSVLSIFFIIARLWRPTRGLVAMAGLLFCFLESQVMVAGCGPYLPVSFQLMLNPRTAFTGWRQASGAVSVEMEAARQTQEAVKGRTTFQPGDRLSGPTNTVTQVSEARDSPAYRAAKTERESVRKPAPAPPRPTPPLSASAAPPPETARTANNRTNSLNPAGTHESTPPVASSRNRSDPAVTGVAAVTAPRTDGAIDPAPGRVPLDPGKPAAEMTHVTTTTAPPAPSSSSDPDEIADAVPKSGAVAEKSPSGQPPAADPPSPRQPGEPKGAELGRERAFVEAVGDFNGDGKADVVWRDRQTGFVYMLLLDGRRVLGNRKLGVIRSPLTRAVEVGDSNGDGRDDIVWRKQARMQLWIIDGLQVLSMQFIQNQPRLISRIDERTAQRTRAIAEVLRKETQDYLIATAAKRAAHPIPVPPKPAVFADPPFTTTPSQPAILPMGGDAPVKSTPGSGDTPRLALGLMAMALPPTVSTRLGLLKIPGGRGLLLFAELDTIVFDAMLVIAAVFVFRALQRRSAGVTPFFWPLLFLTMSITAALAYVSTNYGTLFRQREMVFLCLCLLPLIVSSVSAPVRNERTIELPVDASTAAELP